MNTRRAFVAIALAICATGSMSAMSPLVRTIIITAPPQLNSTGQAIVNELRRQGFTASDDLKRWIADAVQATDSRQFLVQCQPADSLSIGFNVTGSGKLRVNFGDGSSAALILTSTAQNLSHAYATAARRPVVLVGKVVLE